MIQEIIEGVAQVLYQTFGDEYKIYENDVEQGLQEPCFFLGVLQPSLSPLPGGRFLSQNPLDVQYFPASRRDNQTLLCVAERLQTCLELITLPDGAMVRGTERSYAITDNVLHFLVTYPVTLRRPREETPMQEVQVDATTKKGE